MAGVESDGSGKVQPRRNKTKRLMLRTVVIVVIAVASFISSIRTTVSSYSKDDASFHVQSSASQQRSNKCTPRTYPFPSRYYGTPLTISSCLVAKPVSDGDPFSQLSKRRVNVARLSSKVSSRCCLPSR